MKNEKKFIVDIKSMQGITVSGERISITKLFDIYRKAGVLFWNSDEGETPIAIDKDTEVNFIDTKLLSEEEFEKLYKKLENE